MRRLTSLLVIPLLAVYGASATANPSNPPETRSWHLAAPSGVAPESEPNNTCEQAVANPYT